MQNDIGYLIKNIHDRLRAKADADLKHYNLTFAQSRVVALLEGRGGQATQKEIEQFLDVSHPTVVGIISRMEKNNYVTSWIDADHRNKIVCLTPQAQSIAIELQQNIARNEQELLSPLTQREQNHLREMLMAISENMD